VPGQLKRHVAGFDKLVVGSKVKAELTKQGSGYAVTAVK